ncbi:ABC transporter permease subunit [Candidatus Pelagibacter sp.]|nr:ABC transporter permease subunit [Candidatus Pelagibacter sp.]|tara:strand:- start:57 stop:2183 length:2127 start_codon:yes stop_codon:yes gene_type:complete
MSSEQTVIVDKSGSSKSVITYVAIILVFLVALFLSSQSEGPSKLPKVVTDEFTFTAWVNDGEDYLKKNYRWMTKIIAGYIKSGYYFLEDFLIDSPWLLVASIIFLPCLIAGGLRLGLYSLFVIYFWGAVGMWDESLQTVALMGLSVLLCVFFGVILGVLCSQSDRFDGFMKPILDTMQVMPAFVYLFPALFFFGIGGAPAILATMIYAMPPVIRLTNSGIRQVSKDTIESATSFGSSKLQLLFKIKIPLSLPSIMMGINQVIMMALALVVLACFIGAEGIGGQVWLAIRNLDVGWAMEGGLCILFMAIMFDRFSMSLTKQKDILPSDVQPFYLLPQSWEKFQVARLIEKPILYLHFAINLICKSVTNLIATFVKYIFSIFNKENAEDLREFLSRRYYVIPSFIVFIIISLVDSYLISIGTFPEEWKLSIRQPIADGVKSLTINPGFIAFTKGLRAFVYLNLLRPLDTFLTHIPWWYTMSVFVAIGYFTVGLRFAIITALLLLFIGACGIWPQSMITLSSVLVSVVLCFAIGVPLGIIASYNQRFKEVLNVVLDAMQTLPYFCYLIPVLMFFGGGIVSAVLATVIYSIPPIIRLTALGLTQVSGTYSEVSRSFGGTLLQTLQKIKFPLAVPSLVIGFNQTVVMAFAMQIVTPLIGGKGLGLEVFNGLARSDTGRGLAAGIGIVLLAIIIDRITLAWTKKQRQALGLEAN